MNATFTEQQPMRVEPIALSTGTFESAENRARIIENIYETYAESIYRFVYFKVGNREDAEDITSQVFMKAANSLDTGQEERTKQAWLYQVARTTITDHWRHFYKGPTTSLEAIEEAAPLHLAAPSLLLDATEDGEVEEGAIRVKGILDKLPENYRQVLYYRFLKSYSLKETAAAIGVTEANVKVLQYRALQKALKIGEQASTAI